MILCLLCSAAYLAGCAETVEGTDTADSMESRNRNGGHGFYGQPFEDAVHYIEAFLSEHMPITQ